MDLSFWVIIIVSIQGFIYTFYGLWVVSTTSKSGSHEAIPYKSLLLGPDINFIENFGYTNP